MNNENETMINTEEPLEVSEEEMKMLMEASAQIDRGEVCTQEEMEEFFAGMKKRIIEYRRKNNFLKVGS